MEAQFDDRIEKYITGHLAGTERERFESEMLADPALDKAVREHRTAWEIGELLMEEKLRSKIRKRFSAAPPPPPPGSTFFKNWIFAVAVLLFLGIAVFFIFKNKQNAPRQEPLKTLPTPEVLPEKAPTETMPTPPEKSKNDSATKPKIPIAKTQKQSPLRVLALANYRVPEGLSGVRGAGDNENLIFAKKAFFEKNYAQTLHLLKNLPENDHQEALLFRAHAHFSMGNFEAAARDFSDLERGGIYLCEAQWFGLLARMAAGGADKKALNAELEAIRQAADHPYQKAAEAISF